METTIYERWGKERDQETGIKNSHEELASHLPLFKVTKNTAEAACHSYFIKQNSEVHRKRKPGLDDARGPQQNRIWCSSPEKELYLSYYIKTKIILPLLLYFLLNIIRWIIPNT